MSLRTLLVGFVLIGSLPAQVDEQKPPEPKGAEQAAVAAPAESAEPDPLRTQCENSDFDEYTTYENQLAYLRRIQATSTVMKSGDYGETWEGRRLQYVVFSRPAIAQPWEAALLGKPVVLFQGNVHGGERTLRESLLILIRELATAGTTANAQLDQVTVVIAPQVNPDGFGDGRRSTRGNSWGLDLNRDYMKLEQPAIQNLVRNLYHRWHPHVIVDGHNGGARPYNLNYITSGNAAVDQRLVDLCNQKIFPLVSERLEDREMSAFYYPGGTKEYWRGAPTYPRICMTYACLAGALGITFESPRQSIEHGVTSGLYGFQAVLEYVAEHPDEIIGTVNRARRDAIAVGQDVGGEVPIEMKAVDQDYTVSYRIRDGDDWVTVEDGKLRTKPEITKTRPRPFAYVLPREARETVELLRRHDITVEVLEEQTRLTVDAYLVKDITYGRAYDHAATVQVEVGEVVELDRRFPKGTFVVPTAQVMGRVVTYLLEPETDDNVVLWNTMDALLPKPQLARLKERAARAEDAVAEAAVDATAGGTAAGDTTAGDATAGDTAAAAGAAAAGEAKGATGAGAATTGATATDSAPPGRAGQRGRGRFFSGRRRARETRPILPIYKLMQETPLPTRIVGN